MDSKSAIWCLLLFIGNVFAEPCPDYLSVNITDGAPLEHDRLLKDGIVYDQKNYYRSGGAIFGCVCNLRRCLRKCCGKNEVFVNDTCVESPGDAISFPVYNLTQEQANASAGLFVVYGSHCLNTHDSIRADGARLYLQTDGSVYYVEDDYTNIYSVENYCIDIVDGVMSGFTCEAKESGEETFIKGNGMIISTPFLLITFIVYFVLPERNIHRRALMSYVFTLLIAYITLVTIQLYTGQFPDVACHILGHLIIFFFLVSFFWMNVMCIDMWLAFSGMRTVLSKQTAERKRFIIYCVYAWGVPTLHTIIVFLINTYGDPDASYYPGIGKRRCFLGEELPTFYYFYLPMAILIGINIILFIATTVRIQRIKRETKMLKHSESKRHSYEDDKQKFNLYLKLMFAMGVNWTMELVSWAVDWKVKETPTFIWYLTDFTNAMYGLLIFMIFVFKKKIWKSLQKRYYVFVGKPHLAHTMTQSSGLGTRTSNYSTTETNLNSDYRLNEMRNSKPEESGLTAA